LRITNVTSNERIDADDWKVFDNKIVVLKADCDAHGSGRNYVIGVQCTDASGNSSASSVTVTVPVKAPKGYPGWFGMGPGPQRF
jgi:hypothetical protein